MEELIEGAEGGAIMGAGLSVASQLFSDGDLDLSEVAEDTIAGAMTGGIVGLGLGIIDDIF